jgi:hypothetical protein
LAQALAELDPADAAAILAHADGAPFNRICKTHGTGRDVMRDRLDGLMDFLRLRLVEGR